MAVMVAPMMVTPMMVTPMMVTPMMVTPMMVAPMMVAPMMVTPMMVTPMMVTPVIVATVIVATVIVAATMVVLGLAYRSDIFHFLGLRFRDRILRRILCGHETTAQAQECRCAWKDEFANYFLESIHDDDSPFYGDALPSR